MKTFETEKNNIPEGATHYRNECESWNFMWLKVSQEGWWVRYDNGTGRFWRSDWIDDNGLSGEIKQIPSSPTETPEEKEALDAIKQVDWGQILRSSIKFAKHERAMGEGDVRVGDSDLTSEEFLLMCHNIAEVTEKPETPEAKDKREAVQKAMDFLAEDDHGGEAYYYKGWFEALYDEGMLTNYRKGE